jgi:hypothetical protein
MPVFYGAIDLSKNELRNAVVQNLGAPPGTPTKGQIYMDSALNNLYFYDGTAWVSTRSSGALTPATAVTTQAVGDTPTVGVSTNYARQDHLHGREPFGAVTAETTFGTSSANGVATTLPRSDHTHGNPAHGLPAHSTIPLNALLTATSSYSMGGNFLTGVADPVNPQDAATKNYTDNAIAGLSWKDSVRLATTASFGASIPVGPQTVDGVATAVGDRVLIKNQATGAQNGIYIAASAGLTWQRATDADASNEIEGMAVFVNEGTANADTSWVCTTNAPITINTTALVFVQFGSGAVYTAGGGLTLTGNRFDVVAGDTSLTVSAGSMIVNTAVIATVASVAAKAGKFAAALTGTASPETVTHNLNTRDIALTVLNGASPYTAVEVDWDATTVNTATIRYNPNLGAGYRCVVVG